MAGAAPFPENPVQDLCYEATCPICLEYFTEPVILPECGHNFCRACLIQHWSERDKEAASRLCPQCRAPFQQRSHVIPNWQLASVVEIAKKLGLQKNQIKAEREKTVMAFRQLYQFLEEQERFLLAKMEEVEKEIVKKRDEHLAKLSGELFSLQRLIQDMEDNSQQPTSEILQVRMVLRCHRKEKFEKNVVSPPTLKWEIWDFCDLTPFLVGVMEQFKGNDGWYKFTLHKIQNSLVFGLQSQIAHFTLDPDTAHPRLFLSEDLKSVQYRSKAQVLPSHPDRFNEWESVLGLKSFTTGRYFWEVTVGSEEAWAVGVARRSVKRKGMFDLGPQEGIWAMGKFEGNYRGINLTDNPILFLDRMPKRIRVTLNCEGGRVAFFDASTAALLFTFPTASFAKQALHPWFWLCKKTPGHTVALRLETIVNKFTAVATTQMQPSLPDWAMSKSPACKV
ncbi:hypothetical protein JD844_013601 [Phrynosoma platyrhinos]|uniref:Uncharacterized protein n=1 Tax=Phrynosoma platyrhinos TaxID=52577 RepID=A0ABQ7TLG0_PHRPL|nr:hypothetical protein JD844_013601 [Phrynosoma platyrhinos]